MCEGHHALAAEEVKRVPKPPRVPEIRTKVPGSAVALESAPPLIVEAVADVVSDSTAKVLTEAGVQPGRGKRRVENRQEVPSPNAAQTVSTPEMTKLSHCLELLEQLETMRRNGTTPGGKKHMQRRLWETNKLADFFGLVMPMNAEDNFGKSAGFRKNIFTRLRNAATQILSEEEMLSRFQTFLND